MGLSSAVPFLMQRKGVSDSEQGQFSFATWPFSLKLLWAPLVDSIYHSRFGRRKTWIVPAQLAIGALLLWSAPRIDAWLGEGAQSADAPVEVGTLTMLFFSFFFLAATQDIAVDGLALTILSPANKELGATCNTIGQSLGFLVSSAGFLALYSHEFCNKYLRAESAASDVGMLSLGGFMMFWGWIFVASTALVVATVRKDEHAPLRGSLTSILGSAYEEMLSVLKLPAVRNISAIMLTCRAALGVFGQATSLHLTRAGMPKEHLAMLASVTMALGMLVQLYVSGRHLTNADGEAKALRVFGNIYPFRLLMGGVSLLIVKAVGAYHASEGGLPYWLYGVISLSFFAFIAVQETAFVAQMAFFNRVADPAIGGTYMTMLNTIANLGTAWPNTAALFLIDYGEWKRPCSCIAAGEDGVFADVYGVVADAWKQAQTYLQAYLLASPAVAGSGSCGCKPGERVVPSEVIVDGYTFTCVVSLVIGTAWFVTMRPRIFAVQAMPASAWLTRRASDIKTNV